MRRAPSALVSIGGFGVAVATLSVATTATIVLVAPPPPAARMSAAEAIGALRRPTPTLSRELSGEPRAGARAPALEALVADQLHRPPTTVRVTWLDTVGSRQERERARSDPSGGAGQGVPMIFRARGKGLFERLDASRESAAYRAMLLDVPHAPFTLSVRRPDGRWWSVAPPRPWLTVWQRNVLASLVVTLLLLAPLAWLFARRLTDPFRALAGALVDRAEAIPQGGPRELREAAAAIAAMRDRLAAEAGERARMLTAIAHDLRTPLTGLRLRIEAVHESQRARMIADVERMQAMIDEVLGFARAAARPPELLDVRPMLADIVAGMPARDGALRLRDGAAARISAPAPAFRRAVENLLRNALDYAGGGTVSVEPSAAIVRISVEDAGPGIAAADRDRLLRPFERGETSRSRSTGGAGLGLSIVRDFAIGQRGSFTLADAPGGGTRAILELPAA
ncbi:HAMP domain-containing histidine kinase [Sphingomonas sp. RHCKR7]|uniref:sensor histidine kinase n=1 Tax=Sphingomonas folli TaxID=2862497 RepID=UPI001CA4F699|nr:HAMP domain-containing sensor histidine kinase [Sphingomonas folli]MBW6526456.1 HAMP domain-containing histidine kinase [Sphingomonas folli]